MHNQNTISIAKIDDTDEIMKFIDNEWKKGHILGISKDYFLYEYKNKDHLNFVISKNQANKINGILGFIKSSSDDNATVWTTMWKVSKSSGSPMLGVDILNFLRRQGFKTVMSLGINLKTEEIYNYLGFNVGVLDHYFILNQKINEYKISIIPDRFLNNHISPFKDENLFFSKLKFKDLEESFDFNKYNFRIPYKDLNYFKHRYFEHPIYHYDVYGLYNDTKLLAMVVVRISQYIESTCMRIVDFYGEEHILDSMVANLMEVMYLDNHEYIDFFSLGLNEATIFKAGFLKINYNEGDVVIPNYFEPFVQKNITIRYFTDSQSFENLRIYKADGDQDRPTFINKSNFL